MISLLAHAVYDVARFTDGRNSFSPDALQYYRIRMGFGADIVVERRFADFTYDMNTGRRILLENQIETNEMVFVDALGYLSIFDLLFPTLGSFPDSEPIACQSYLAAAAYFANVVRRSIEPFVLPLTHQQNNYFNSQNETIFNATFRQQSYRIVLQPSCFVIYICLSLNILLWSIILLALSGRAEIPEGNNELDIMTQLVTDTEDLSVALGPERMVRTSDNRQNNPCRTLGTVRVLVRKMDESEQLFGDSGGEGVVNIALHEMLPVPENDGDSVLAVSNERPPAEGQSKL